MNFFTPYRSDKHRAEELLEALRGAVLAKTPAQSMKRIRQALESDRGRRGLIPRPPPDPILVRKFHRLGWTPEEIAARTCADVVQIFEVLTRLKLRANRQRSEAA